MGVLEGIEESIQKTKTTKMDLNPTKKYTKSHKTWTPVRFKNPQGNETRG